MDITPYYIAKLRGVLSQRQRENYSYSLRAFARDLDIHSSSLSQILKQKRNLPFNKAKDVTLKLGLSPQDTKLFMESLYRSKISIDSIKIDACDKRHLLDESHYTVIAEWEHYAALELFNLKNFVFNPKNISLKLNITENRALVVLQNLIDTSLISKTEEGHFKPEYSDIKTTEDVVNLALKKSHKESLDLGVKKLDEIAIELRDFSSITTAIDMNQIPQAKKLIREFRQKMSKLLEEGEKTEVFQLAVQFYPLTQPSTQDLSI